MSSQLGIRSYPKVLRETPNDRLDLKILTTDATVLDDGTFYFVIMKDKKQIVGLVPYESIFHPGIKIQSVNSDVEIGKCVDIVQVIDNCLPANWRHTAQQQAKLAQLIANDIERWHELNPPTEEDLEATALLEEKLAEIEELQEQIKLLKGYPDED